jgi:hypothetical protein
MSFKEQIQKDHSIFINSNEMAETVIIDGEETEAIYNQNAVDDLQDGIYTKKDELYVVSSFFDTIPVPGERIKVNNNYLTVETVENFGGMCHIVFEGVDS